MIPWRDLIIENLPELMDHYYWIIMKWIKFEMVAKNPDKITHNLILAEITKMDQKDPGLTRNDP